MSLESGTRIVDLVATNPVGATDFASQGDDHIRLIKACLQGSFPSLGATAVTATAEELNGLHALTASKAVATNASGIAVASSTSDAELAGLHSLTASRAVVTTAGGILIASAVTTTELGYVSGVTSAIQAQLAGLQPLDADLTALAALTTTSFGRDFNALADLAATATKLAALVPTWTGAHTFTPGSSVTAITINGHSGNEAVRFNKPDDGVIATFLRSGGNSTNLQISAVDATAITLDVQGSSARALHLSANGVSSVEISAANVVSINDAGTLRAAGFRGAAGRTMSSQGSILETDNGKRITCNFAGGTLTIANVAASGLLTDGIVIVTNYLASVSLVMTTGTINWFNGSSVSTGSRTLAVGAVVTIVMDAQDSSVHIWGAGIS